MAKPKPKPQTTITAHMLRALLAERHKEDVFVPECKNGPTHTATQLRRLDAWVMRKSWTQFSTIGYEIKVSRQDFERDQKWVEYLGYCHEFYFVCPTGMIKATELPKGVGLLWASANGAKLLTKTKSEKRVPDPGLAHDLMVYVLMCRTKIDSERVDIPTFRGASEYYRECVEQATARDQLATFVGKHIRDQFRLQEERMEKIGRRAQAAERLFEKLASLGIKAEGDWPDTWRMGREIDALFGKLPDGFEHRVRRVGSEIEELLSALGEIRRKPEAPMESM